MPSLQEPSVSSSASASSSSSASITNYQLPITNASPESAAKNLLAVYADLFKARLTFLVLLTTLVGFYLGFRGRVDYWLMLHSLLGTALVAAGAAALNQFLEREYDAKMHRTRN